MIEQDYSGPREIFFFQKAGRGTSFTSDYGGHQVVIYVTEKTQKIRIWVDGNEWKMEKEIEGVSNG